MYLVEVNTKMNSTHNPCKELDNVTEGKLSAFVGRLPVWLKCFEKKKLH